MSRDESNLPFLCALVLFAGLAMGAAFERQAPAQTRATLMADQSETMDKEAAQAFIAQILPVATAANPKYRSGDAAELSIWLTKSVRFGPDATARGITVEMDEQALVFNGDVQTAINTHDVSFALEDVQVSEYRYPQDTTESGEPALGIMFKCNSGKCVRSKWNGAQSSKEQTDLYVYNAAERAKILKAFEILKTAAGNRA
jgi:hypothetical protein